MFVCNVTKYLFKTLPVETVIDSPRRLPSEEGRSVGETFCEVVNGAEDTCKEPTSHDLLLPEIGTALRLIILLCGFYLLNDKLQQSVSLRYTAGYRARVIGDAQPDANTVAHQTQFLGQLDDCRVLELRHSRCDVANKGSRFL